MGDETREHTVAVRGVRKAMAKAMEHSALRIPQATVSRVVSMDRSHELVTSLRAHPDYEGVRVNAMVLVAHALARACRRHTELNSTWVEQTREILVREYVNLGVAVATDRGLLVPNVKGADEMTLPQLANALDELVTKARAGACTAEDLRGGTITLTNVGALGVDGARPLVNPGESAILALTAVRTVPVVCDGAVVPGRVCTLDLTIDHRVVDGALAATFLADVLQLLENPTA